jgi:hypothetical protein
MQRLSLTLSLESWQLLMELPVSHTREFQLEDRNFTIVDTEEFKRIIKLAKLKTVPVP